MVVRVGGYNNGRHSCVVREGHGGPWVGIRPLLQSSTILLYVPNTRPYEGGTWQIIYGGMMYKLYVAIHGGWGMRKVDEIERAIERGFGLHTDDTKTLHSSTLTHTDIFLLLPCLLSGRIST